MSSTQFVDFTPVTFVTRCEESVIVPEEIQTFLPTYGGSIYIEQLPQGIRRVEEVRWLIEDRLFLGKVKHIAVFPNNPQNRYASAYIHFLHWNYTSPAVELANIIANRHWTNQSFVHLTNVFRAPDTVQFHDLDYPYYTKTGKPMTFLRVQPISNEVGCDLATIDQLPKLKLEPSDWTSLYIPRIPENLQFEHSEGSTQTQMLMWIFEEVLRVGRVKRIEYIRRETNKEQDVLVHSAFIHFDYWCDNYDAHCLRNTLEKHEAWKMNGRFPYHRQNSQFEILDSNGNRKPHYITLKINHAPIPDADPMLNVHQLAVAKSSLEKQVIYLMEENKRLSLEKEEAMKELDDHKRMIKNMQIENGTLLNHLMEKIVPDLDAFQPSPLERCNAMDEYDDMPELIPIGGYPLDQSEEGHGI